jgi:hypothetical protein
LVDRIGRYSNYGTRTSRKKPGLLDLLIDCYRLEGEQIKELVDELDNPNPAQPKKADVPDRGDIADFLSNPL